MSILCTIDGFSESMFLSDMYEQDVVLELDQKIAKSKQINEKEAVRLSTIDVAQLVDMDGDGGLCFQELLQEQLLTEKLGIDC